VTDSPTDHKDEWHALATERVAALLGTRPAGLTASEAAERLDTSGPNSLQATKPPGVLSLFLQQLASPLVILLIIAAAVSLIAQHPVDAIVIALVVVLNAVIGTTQEWRAEEALEALRRLSAPHARVVRDDEVSVVDAADVVPGDVLLLETGDRVAADVRITEATELTIDESALTGESDPVEKYVAELDSATPLADRRNMAWTSTAVTAGRGLGIVVETGMQTVIGQIARDVQQTEREETPLQARLARLGVYIGIASVTAAISIFLFGIWRGIDVVEMLLFAVAAAVSAIPEGLPAIISVVLAVGVQRMSRREAIVRRLPAVETLGSTTVVCSDKTGTITRNQMTVVRMWTPAGTYRVEGDGFAPVGRILTDEDVPADLTAAEETGLRLQLEIGLLANNAVLQHDTDHWSVQGNPTDGALLVVAHKGGLRLDDYELRERRDEIPFTSSRKYAATLNTWDEGARLLVKGAPERLLAACTRVLVGDAVHALDSVARAEIQAANDDLAEQALRVVAAAYRDMPAQATGTDRADAEADLVFVGMWGLLDPPREEAIAAIASAHLAGIRVVMITGDHARTATAIAKRVGIVGPGDQVLSGEDLDALSDEDLRTRVARVAVYARVTSEHKLRIVSALKAQGETVAMTGDGVNDAPALKAADIGIAMGETGTEVAKEAADMVLADDNFATIIDAVEEGRVIFANLRRVVAFLMTTSSAEMLMLVAALVLGFPLPITAVMILWINLVTDGITGIPLGLEPKHSEVLRQPPRPPDEGVLTGVAVSRVVVLAIIAATGTLALFAWESQTKDLAHARTIAFTTLVAFEWFKSITWRTSNQSVFTVGLFSNRWLALVLAIAISLQLAAIYTPVGQLAFGTVPLSADEWARVIVVASTVLFLDEFGKLIRRWLARRASR
jgi:P-type Ca2+ transporter type 2C